MQVGGAHCPPARRRGDHIMPPLGTNQEGFEPTLTGVDCMLLSLPWPALKAWVLGTVTPPPISRQHSQIREYQVVCACWTYSQLWLSLFRTRCGASPQKTEVQTSSFRGVLFGINRLMSRVHPCRKSRSQSDLGNVVEHHRG